MNYIELAQIVDLSEVADFSKISLYLIRSVNEYSDSHIIDEDILIESANFSSISQSENKVIYISKESDTDFGLLQVKKYDISSSEYPVINYPIKRQSSGLLNGFLRLKSNNLNIKYSIYIDDNLVFTKEIISSTSDWQWCDFNCSVGNSNIHKLGVKIETDDVKYDKLYLSKSNISEPDEYISLEYSESPYITIHVRIFDTLGEYNYTPNSQTTIYDYKNTLEGITGDGWYNFNMKKLNNEEEIDFNQFKAIVVSSSGSSNKNYVMWKKNDFDEYSPLPSAMKYE